MMTCETTCDVDSLSGCCCFTGHRPEKLQTAVRDVIADLEEEIDRVIERGITTFISGMSRGVDLWAAQIVAERKRRNGNIKLIAAVPYVFFSSAWSGEWRELYRKMVMAADAVRCFGEDYSPYIYQMRNRWMVDRSKIVIASFSGHAGGTKNTVEYAMSRGVEVRFIRG